MLSVDEAASELGYSPNDIRTLCSGERFPGALYTGIDWELPEPLVMRLPEGRTVMPVCLSAIRTAVREGRWRVSVHAQREADEEQLLTDDVLDAVSRGEIIENYPEDPRGPSALVLGNLDGGPLHAVCGFGYGAASNGPLVLITVYIPKPPRWLDERTRRRVQAEEA